MTPSGHPICSAPPVWTSMGTRRTFGSDSAVHCGSYFGVNTRTSLLSASELRSFNFTKTDQSSPEMSQQKARRGRSLYQRSADLFYNTTQNQCRFMFLGTNMVNIHVYLIHVVNNIFVCKIYTLIYRMYIAYRTR